MRDTSHLFLLKAAGLQQMFFNWDVSLIYVLIYVNSHLREFEDSSKACLLGPMKVHLDVRLED